MYVYVYICIYVYMYRRVQDLASDSVRLREVNTLLIDKEESPTCEECQWDKFE